MNKLTSTLSLSVLGLVVPACVVDDAAPADDEVTRSQESEALTGLASCPVSGTDIHRSLVVTDPEVLAKFGFKRVMNRIRSTAGVAASQTNKAVWQNWMRTFDTPACDDPDIDPNGYGLACPRTEEAKLATIDPFATGTDVTFEPVGVFDRFDLAPASGAHCGEYRIVFAMNSTNPNVGGRGFVIFEAALPNPHPEQGLAACLPVAEFWQGLTDDDDVNSRARKLEKFYFTGGAVAGFPAIVDAHHYGLAVDSAPFGAGQVRTNFFVNFFEWHLREFKLHEDCTTGTCKLAFDHVTVKTNPADELFEGTHSKSAAFRTAFVTQVKALAARNVNTIKMTIGDDFNEFESVSQRFDVLYSATANNAMRNAIQTKLTALGITDLTPANIMDRATTQTCAGCHQVSNGADLGGTPALIWPNSLQFVQIDEGSQLSEALRKKFLPRRKNVLEGFINDQCAGASDTEAEAQVDTGLTIGGSPVGAAN